MQRRWKSSFFLFCGILVHSPHMLCSKAGRELSALYGAFGCECRSEIVAHICIILQTNNAASSREQSVSLSSFMLDVILRCVNICVWYVLKRPSSLSWYYLCNYHRRRWKRSKLERLRWRRERDRGRKSVWEKINGFGPNPRLNLCLTPHWKEESGHRVEKLFKVWVSRLAVHLYSDGSDDWTVIYFHFCLLFMLALGPPCVPFSFSIVHVC